LRYDLPQGSVDLVFWPEGGTCNGTCHTASTGFAAFLGGLMNWNYMMAGSASTNPLLFVAAVAIILGWKVSGYIGADYALLRWIGTPWAGKKVAETQTVSGVAQPVYQESSAD